MSFNRWRSGWSRVGRNVVFGVRDMWKWGRLIYYLLHPAKYQTINHQRTYASLKRRATRWKQPCPSQEILPDGIGFSMEFQLVPSWRTVGNSALNCTKEIKLKVEGTWTVCVAVMEKWVSFKMKINLWLLILISTPSNHSQHVSHGIQQRKRR